MVGSSQNIALSNIVLNTAVAKSFADFADELEGKENFDEALDKLLAKTFSEHKRILFSGNSYSKEWEAEAKARGLSSFKTSPEAYEHFTDEKNIELFAQHKVFNETELASRVAIMMEDYAKKINIEGLTMIEMTRRDILPAIESFAKDTANAAISKRQLLPNLDCSYEENLVYKLSELCAGIDESCSELEAELDSAKEIREAGERAEYCRDNVIGVMELFYQATKVQTMTYLIFETYLVVCVIYFVMTFSITRLLRMVEKKLAGSSSYTICGSQSDPRAEIHVTEVQ
jgi:glutamine synthetase